METHQETQAHLHIASMTEKENITKFVPPEKVADVDKDSSKKTNEGIVILGDSANIVKIKSKRSTSHLSGEKNNQNSVQPFQNEEGGKLKTVESRFKQASQPKISKLTMRPRDFMLTSIKQNEIAKFSIERQVGLLKNTMQIRMQGKNSQIIALQKKFTLLGNKIMLKIPQKTEQLSVSQIEHLSEKLTNPLLGYLQGNFDGSIFNLYEVDQITHKNQIIATFQYFAEVGKMGSPRKVKIFIKDHTVANIITNLLPEQNLKQFIERSGPSPAVHCYSNKPSTYDQQSDTYGMNFNCMKQVLPSVHNMIMINQNSAPVLKLFKSGVNSYDLELGHPIVPLVGCAFAISSFLFKFVSQ